MQRYSAWKEGNHSPAAVQQSKLNADTIIMAIIIVINIIIIIIILPPAAPCLLALL